MFFEWKERFSQEHKKAKQEAHTRIMRECGGSGKHFSIPPPDFVPHSLSIGNKCEKCKDDFENENSLKRHIQLEHNEDIKKAFSKVAMEMVVKDNKYVDWLSKTTSVNIENDKSTISEMQKANRILTERLKAKNENTYKLVKGRQRCESNTKKKLSI